MRIVSVARVPRSCAGSTPGNVTPPRDPWIAYEKVDPTPTDLGEEAVKGVLDAAGVSAADVALVIGDCPTPLETCPCEAQRVAGRFGLKTPAFDVSGGHVALLRHLQTLADRGEPDESQWVVSFSAGLLTPVRGSADAEDAAGALLVRRGPGPASGRLADERTGASRPEAGTPSRPGLTVDRVYCTSARSRSSGELREAFGADVDAALRLTSSEGPGETLVLVAYDPPPAEREVAALVAGGSVRVRRGPDSAGAGAYEILSDAWDEAVASSRTVLLAGGVGSGHGYALLRPSEG